MRKVVAIFLSALLVGCATSPTPIAQAKNVPDDRVYYRPQDTSQAATAVFVRDSGAFGSGVYQHLTINEEKAAALDVGEKVTFKLPAGEYAFGIRMTDPFGATAPFSIDQRLETGKSYFYRILIDQYGARIQRTLGKPAE